MAHTGGGPGGPGAQARAGVAQASRTARRTDDRAERRGGEQPRAKGPRVGEASPIGGPPTAHRVKRSGWQPSLRQAATPQRGGTSDRREEEAGATAPRKAPRRVQAGEATSVRRHDEASRRRRQGRHRPASAHDRGTREREEEVHSMPYSTHDMTHSNPDIRNGRG